MNTCLSALCPSAIPFPTDGTPIAIVGFGPGCVPQAYTLSVSGDLVVDCPGVLNCLTTVFPEISSEGIDCGDLQTNGLVPPAGDVFYWGVQVVGGVCEPRPFRAPDALTFPDCSTSTPVANVPGTPFLYLGYNASCEYEIQQATIPNIPTDCTLATVAADGDSLNVLAYSSPACELEIRTIELWSCEKTKDCMGDIIPGVNGTSDIDCAAVLASATAANTGSSFYVWGVDYTDGSNCAGKFTELPPLFGCDQTLDCLNVPNLGDGNGTVDCAAVAATTLPAPIANLGVYSTGASCAVGLVAPYSLSCNEVLGILNIPHTVDASGQCVPDCSAPVGGYPAPTYVYGVYTNGGVCEAGLTQLPPAQDVCAAVPGCFGVDPASSGTPACDTTTHTNAGALVAPVGVISADGGTTCQMGTWDLDTEVLFGTLNLPALPAGGIDCAAVATNALTEGHAIGVVSDGAGGCVVGLIEVTPHPLCTTEIGCLPIPGTDPLVNDGALDCAAVATNADLPVPADTVGTYQLTLHVQDPPLATGECAVFKWEEVVPKTCPNKPLGLAESAQIQQYIADGNVIVNSSGQFLPPIPAYIDAAGELAIANNQETIAHHSVWITGWADGSGADTTQVCIGVSGIVRCDDPTGTPLSAILPQGQYWLSDGQSPTPPNGADLVPWTSQQPEPGAVLTPGGTSFVYQDPLNPLANATTLQPLFQVLDGCCISYNTFRPQRLCTPDVDVPDEDELCCSCETINVTDAAITGLTTIDGAGANTAVNVGQILSPYNGNTLDAGKLCPPIPMRSFIPDGTSGTSYFMVSDNRFREFEPEFYATEILEDGRVVICSDKLINCPGHGLIPGEDYYLGGVPTIVGGPTWTTTRPDIGEPGFVDCQTIRKHIWHVVDEDTIVLKTKNSFEVCIAEEEENCNVITLPAVEGGSVFDIPVDTTLDFCPPAPARTAQSLTGPYLATASATILANPPLGGDRLREKVYFVSSITANADGTYTITQHDDECYKCPDHGLLVGQYYWLGEDGGPTYTDVRPAQQAVKQAFGGNPSVDGVMPQVLWFVMDEDTLRLSPDQPSEPVVPRCIVMEADNGVCLEVCPVESPVGSGTYILQFTPQ